MASERVNEDRARLLRGVVRKCLLVEDTGSRRSRGDAFQAAENSR